MHPKISGMKYSIHKAFLLFILSVICLVFAGCGGSGGGGSLAGGGIGGTGITASGAITGFGSIFVNGIEFGTVDASRDVDGEISVSDGTDDDTVLGIGMVVTVDGTLNDDGVTGTAKSIQYDPTVQGPVQGPIIDVDPLTRSFTVMGISVTVQKVNTVFSYVTFDTLQPDDLVDVSGFFDAGGVLQATRLERKDGNEIVVKGTVTGLADTAFTLEVDQAASTYPVDTTAAEFPNGEPTDNQYVEVKGTLDNSLNVISATRVELKSEGFDDTGSASIASIEGIVTDFNGIDDFRVAGQRVNASVAEFYPASLVSDLGPGAEVEIEGPIQDGVLMASRVEAGDE
jgi:hypothetical protein